MPNFTAEINMFTAGYKNSSRLYSLAYIHVHTGFWSKLNKGALSDQLAVYLAKMATTLSLTIAFASSSYSQGAQTRVNYSMAHKLIC